MSCFLEDFLEKLGLYEFFRSNDPSMNFWWASFSPGSPSLENS